MKTVFQRSSSTFLPEYSRNSVIKLIVACGVVFVAFHLTRAITLTLGMGKTMFFTDLAPYVTLAPVDSFLSKFWTIFTYGWIHTGFWELFSNMLWLYCFGSVVQMLIGYKQIVPMFFYCLVAGGIFYLLAQLVPGYTAVPGRAIDGYGTGYVGVYAGLTGFMAASLVLAPQYRFYLGPNFSIPIGVVVAIFLVLMLINVNLELPGISLLAGGALMGWVYVVLLRKGMRPGEWVYDLFGRMEKAATPDERAALKRQDRKRNHILSKLYEPKQGITQKRIDDILDKINQQGYNSLTKEEKEILLKASKEKN